MTAMINSVLGPIAGGLEGVTRPLEVMTHGHVIPELKSLCATDGEIRVLFVDNPRRFLTGDA